MKENKKKIKPWEFLGSWYPREILDYHLQYLEESFAARLSCRRCATSYKLQSIIQNKREDEKKNKQTNKKNKTKTKNKFDYRQ